MALTKKDRDFRFPTVTFLEYKQIEMDRVLTMLFPRLRWDGALTKIRRKGELPIDEFLAELLDDKNTEYLKGFKTNPDIVRRWLETHLLDLVNRGKPEQAVAAPRPLHGETYLLRNPDRCRDYGASQQIYEMLYNAPGGTGSLALRDLRLFFFPQETDLTEYEHSIDVETTALLRLRNLVTSDIPDKSSRENIPPFLPGASKLMAEDIVKLFAYKSYIPRTVMVDYLKILICFHLALYHLKLLKIVPEVVADRNGLHNAETEQYGDTNLPEQWQFGCVVDMANEKNTRMSQLAESSAQIHLGRIPAYIKAQYALKKIVEFANSGFVAGYTAANSLKDILELFGDRYKNHREQFFGNRVANIIDVKEDEEVPSDIAAIIGMALDRFETYIECVYSDRVKLHQSNMIACLESLLMKHRPGALITQVSRTRGAARKFILDTQLLEVLVQLAVLDIDPFRTREIRIDELLDFIRNRYGIYIDKLPHTDGFNGEAGIEDLKALRGNVEAFKERLREIGFYTALSDAYITQNVIPRYPIQPEMEYAT